VFRLPRAVAVQRSRCRRRVPDLSRWAALRDGRQRGDLRRRQGDPIARTVIKNIAVTRDRNPIVIVQGENLSKDADFFLDDKKLPIVTPDQLKESGIDKTKQPSLVIGTTQAGASDRTFCSELQITVIEEEAGVTIGRATTVSVSSIVTRSSRRFRFQFLK
jgi:hypothetical protein